MGLFIRAFILIATLIFLSLGVWLQIVLDLQERPRAMQTAQNIASMVSLTRTAMRHTSITMQASLLDELANREGLRVRAKTPENLPETSTRANNPYWDMVARELKARLGEQTEIRWPRDQVSELWVSFNIDSRAFWLVVANNNLHANTTDSWLEWILATLLLSVLGAAIGAGFINRPLARLAAVARQITQGQAPGVLPERGPAEIRKMNRAFNRMAHDLHQAARDQEIMLAGISHDLRTPLARIRLEIELEELSPPTREAISDDLEQMDHIIGQLLTFARAGNNQPDAQCDLSALLKDYCQNLQHYARKGRSAINCSIAPNLSVKMHGPTITRILDNLWQNSQRYGASPYDKVVRIDISARANEHNVIISVADQGCGMSDAERHELLRPFMRGNVARSNGRGAGLGLAIINRLVSRAGGSFRLYPNQPYGLIAEIILPRHQK